MRAVRVARAWLAWLLVAGLVVQVFLAGLGVFESAARFATHREFGYALSLLPVVLLILAAIGRLGRWQIVLPAVIFLLFILQSVFVIPAIRTSLPFVSALHPVNGFLIVLLAIEMARRSWVLREAGLPQEAA